METAIFIAKPLSDHLDKVKVLLNKATEEYDFNVKCAISNLGFSELIALNTSSYEGKDLKRAAIDMVEVSDKIERENIIASITTYYQLIQSRANEAGKISKNDMLAVIGYFQSEVRMAA